MNYELRLSEDVALSRFRAAMPQVVAPADIGNSQGKIWYGTEFGAFTQIAKNGTHSHRMCPRTGLPVRER